MSSITRYDPFSELARFDTSQWGWQRILSIAATVVVFAVIAFAVTGCSGGGGSSTSIPTVEVPSVPTSFTVVRTPEVTLSATLAWSPPTAQGGAPDSFEIYRSTTAGTAFLPDNLVTSIPVVAGQTTYTYIDNAGLTPVPTYWAVSAKNAGGETPTAEVMYTPIGPPNGTGDTGFGNNFSAALVFADDIGIGGLALDPAKAWTTDLAASAVPAIDYNTGLRPLATEVADLAALPVPVTTLPYLDPATDFLKNNVTYYKQATASTWQGQWEKGASAPQHVSAKWGDNLISQSLTANSTIRIEMVLSKALSTAMTSYTMQSLYGAKNNEVQGTDGTTYPNLTAFVFASNARLTIQKMDGATNPVLLSQPLWAGDGPGFLAGEVNVSGNFTYGFVWNLKNQVLPPDIPSKTGTWRITFSLDPDNSTAGKAVPPASNNTFIDTATNGVRVSDTEVYIEFVVQ